MTRRLQIGFVAALALLVCAAVTACAQDSEADRQQDDEWEVRELSSQYQPMNLVRVASGFDNPWSVAFLPDGRKLVTERPGRLNMIENGQVTEISGLPDIHAQSQGGLMEVSVHPNYEENGWIYLTYSKANDEDATATALLRAQLEGTELVNAEDIFVQNQYSSPGRHYGSRLAWMNDGTLLMSIGDRGADPPRAQDPQDHAGSLLRLNDDGSVPDDNPFVNDPDAADEIYSYGHRNIQGLVVDPSNDTIWATEHGPRGGDELNRIEPGLDYGWPTVTRGLDYRSQEEFPHSEARAMDGMEDPFYEFLPTLAPSGLALVTSEHFPRWQGDLLAGGLRSERIRRLVFDDQEVLHDEELLLGEIGRIRDVREGPDGYIYVLNGESEGGLFRIEPRE